MNHPGSRRHVTPRIVAVVWATLVFPHPTPAQNPNQFGGQDRANAASQLIVLGVQRGIDSLPLTSGQAVTYEFDPASDALGRTARLGPTVLPSSQVIEPGTLALQVAASYFEQAETFQPINYMFTFDGTPRQGVAKLGLTAKADVGLLNFSLVYGISSRIEVSVSVPITVVDAQASEIFSTLSSGLSVPPKDAQLGGYFFTDGNVPSAITALNDGLKPGGPLALRQASLSNLGFAFNDGTHVGVGRISVGGKGILLSTTQLQLAFAPQLFMPSPSENDFSGPGSAAILPQLIATLKLTDALRLHSSVGYDYDFNTAALRSFTWRAGGSFASQRIEVDLGLGGSEYDAPIQWTPSIIHGQATATAPASTGQALDNNTTGTSLVDVLVGAKVRVTDAIVISAGVSIPVVSPAFQPDALGTLAVERTF